MSAGNLKLSLQKHYQEKSKSVLGLNVTRKHDQEKHCKETISEKVNCQLPIAFKCVSWQLKALFTNILTHSLSIEVSTSEKNGSEMEKIISKSVLGLNVIRNHDQEKHCKETLSGKIIRKACVPQILSRNMIRKSFVRKGNIIRKDYQEKPK